MLEIYPKVLSPQNLRFGEVPFELKCLVVSHHKKKIKKKCLVVAPKQTSTTAPAVTKISPCFVLLIFLFFNKFGFLIMVKEYLSSLY